MTSGISEKDHSIPCNTLPSLVFLSNFSSHTIKYHRVDEEDLHSIKKFEIYVHAFIMQ
jgi:hypothetical protein